MMGHDGIDVMARVTAVEILIETAYALTLRQMKDPVAEARRLSEIFARCAGQLAVHGEEPHVPREHGVAVARALDAILGRIRVRVEMRPEDFPTVGTA